MACSAACEADAALQCARTRGCARDWHSLLADLPRTVEVAQPVDRRRSNA